MYSIVLICALIIAFGLGIKTEAHRWRQRALSGKSKRPVISGKAPFYVYSEQDHRKLSEIVREYRQIRAVLSEPEEVLELGAEDLVDYIDGDEVKKATQTFLKQLSDTK